MTSDEFREFMGSKEMVSVLEKIFPASLNKAFPFLRRHALVAWQSGAGAAHDSIAVSDRQWDKAVKEAFYDSWAGLMANQDKAMRIIEESLDNIDAGLEDESDLAANLCRFMVSELAREISESGRDKDYAGFRKALTLARAENGEPFFRTFYHERYTKRNIPGKGMGMMYSIGSASNDFPEYSAEEMQKEIPDRLKALGEVARGIYSERGTQGPCWRANTVRNEAERFWKEFVAGCNNGIPCFAPLYAMYCWVKRTVPLGSVEEESLDRVSGGENSAPLREKLGSPGTNVEEAYLKKQIRSMASDFALALPEREAAVCFLHYAQELTLETAAFRMGLSSPSSITRYKAALANRFREALSQYSELDELELQILFISAVYEECKKRCRGKYN